MVEEYNQKLEVDRQKIKMAVRLQTPVEITTYTLPRNMEIYVRSILTTFLEECHQEHLQEYLVFCLGELLTNAKKANTKRVYFKEKGLDINDPDDYKAGMEHFKEDTLTNIDHYLELQKKEGLYIKLDLQLRGDKVKVEIRNKAKLTQFEKARIQNKLDSVQKYNNMEEVLSNVIDQTEGAGLGIIIIVLMLQKVGLAKENYQVESRGEETVTRIILPCNEQIFAAEEIMTYEFVNLQNTIPVLKTSFEAIEKLLKEPKLSKDDLFLAISKDITLSLLLLKAGNKKDKECNEIRKALDLLSEDEIKALYSTENLEISVIEETEGCKNIWSHAQKTAFVAYNLVKNYENLSKKYTPDELYTAALFNSLGFVLLEAATEEQHNYIQELSSQYELSEKINNVFWSGNARTYINLIYGKRAGLSEKLTAMFSCWNYWEMSPEPLLDAVYTIYLSEMLVYYAEHNIDFYQLDKRVLDFFNITNENQFNLMAKKFAKSV